MSSAIEQQQQDPAPSIGASISGNARIETPSPTQEEDQDDGPAGQTAKLDLKAQNVDSVLSSGTTDNTSSHEKPTSKVMDENTNPKPWDAPAAAPVNNMQTNQSTASGITADTTGPKNDTAASPDQPNDDEDEDETSTPRFSIYIKLHNDVRPPTHPTLSINPPSLTGNLR